MRIFLAFLSIFAGGTEAIAQQRPSSVYHCDFNKASPQGESLRLKQYPDPGQNSYLGKIDLMSGTTVIESTPTKIYQIPFLEEDMYVQIWYAANVRVDAQFSISGSNRQFSGIYRKGSLQQDILCTNLSK